METTRKKFSSQEKVALLKQHLVEKKSIAELCEPSGLQPSVFYRWQQEFFENGASAFDRKPDHPDARLARKVGELEVKLARKNEVLSELMEEHVALKKSLGEN